MSGGFTGLKEKTGTDWGEQMLNTVASKTISHLFTQSDLVDVSVRCFPSSKLLLGSIDSFKMSGRGSVIRCQFRTEEMWFETDAVTLDFSSVLKGKIALKQPTQAIAQVTLTENDINDSFKADLVRKRLENLDLPALTDLSGGEPVSFTDVSIQLLPESRVKIFANADLSNRQVPISLSCTMEAERRRRLRFKNPQFEPDNVPEELRSISQILTGIFAEILDNMVDLDRFNLDGVTLRINRLETENKTLVFSGYAQIERVPNNP